MSNVIKASWNKNAKEWIKTIQNNAIPSRKFTNPAIIKAIKELQGNTIVDIGCGEGWLTREMNNLGWSATGLDATKALILAAQEQSNQNFEVFTFEEIIAGKHMPNGPFDAAVFNFCLYGKDDLTPLITKTLGQLTTEGTILIQTLHPFFLVQNGLAYKGQWVADSWKGLPGNFMDGHSWYARTMEEWVEELNKIQQAKFQIKEVLNNEDRPISLLIKINKI
jgi:2-polyprenyl-3-methyl-5-hydroxy-6-metoxy-1,4-benzoquinol methylase|nr:methyltransferase domain-containing protein [uncultured Allomuricauda sp.]